MNSYKNIETCWKAIERAKTIEEVETLLEKFPESTGDWDIQIEYNTFMEKVYVVYGPNHECKTLDFIVEDDDDWDDDEDDFEEDEDEEEED